MTKLIPVFTVIAAKNDTVVAKLFDFSMHTLTDTQKKVRCANLWLQITYIPLL